MKNKIIISLTVFATFMQMGCTTLEEVVLDESLTGSATSDAMAEGSIAPAYAVLPGLFSHTGYFTLQEISTDEAILPYRGGTDWGDNGIFIDMHRHTYASSHIRIRDTWGNITRGISRSVIAIDALTPQAAGDPTAKLFLAEAKGLRAYYSMLSLDLFGLIFVKESNSETSVILRGTAAVDYIKNEFLSIENEVSTTVGPGRITQGAVWGLLARLYLNAGVYRDPYAATVAFSAADMDQVLLYTSKIINSGQYNLSSEYFEIFDDENHTNKELIFAVDQRADLNGHNLMAYFSLSGDRFPLPGFVRANGTDGPAITSDFYRTWVAAYGAQDPATMDPRFSKKNLIIPADSCVTAANFEIDRGIIRGQQYGLITSANGQPFARCADGIGYKMGKLRNITRADKRKLVNHTEKVDYSAEGSAYSAGYRVLKYEFGKNSDTGRNRGDADIVIVRLADIYMMRAEAKLRRSNDVVGALADVNLVRASRTARIVAPALSTMTLDLLYRERGFEFYWETLRRTDMIRFGKYEGSWTEKTDSNVQKRLFPIPQTAIDGASNQPGYLVQNAGY